VSTQETGFGIYVHVPFCSRRCDYCDFATWTDRHHLMEAYAAACVEELRRATEVEQLPPATSVFFGGGTPSLLPAHLLCRILETVQVAPAAEVTVECNPETVTAELLEAYVAGGVTRVSLGVQSMVPHVLAGLGRQHDPAAVLRSAGLVGRSGIGTYNVDLIYGGAGESDDDWRATLEQALSLDPPPAHVSAYALTVEPGTPLWRDPDRYPDDDDQARRYEIADDVLTGAGFSWYEISNWARPGHECRHNLLYWRQGDYRGIGCAAHSHRGGRRFWNVRTPERYIAAVSAAPPDAPTPAVGGDEQLAGDDRLLEALELALRTRCGVPSEALPDDEVTAALVSRQDGMAVLTRNGRLLANEVSIRLRPPRAGGPQPCEQDVMKMRKG
jgi:putative oxygen-independent coproporphyrinogen III oxidase